ncbi:MAG: DNA (cytosine-5-)-methyltransferase [Flavobacterium sp.]|nr:DNA (cytosine-5-)-methyltransferase [Flavobacterium sp.]
MRFKVASLFDGMSCLQLALNKAGIIPTKYYASEIDKYAMHVTMANFPNTIQIGDVRNVKGSDLGFVDLLGGGSPCQSFSFAGKRKGMATKCDVEILTLSHYLDLKSQNFEFEGQSYLFWEYMRILEELRTINPNIKFLLENVLMGEKWQKILTRAIGINPIKINSALLSAQNRQRLYWTNIASVQDGLFGDLVCSIAQPKDKGILLKDILETDVSDKYFLSGKMLDYLNSRKANYNNGKSNYKTENDIASCINASSRSIDISDNIIIDTNRKARCFTAGGNSGGLHSQMDLVVHNTMPRSSKTGKGGTGPLSRNDGKTYCLDTGNTNAVEMVGAIKFGRTDEAKVLRKENIKNGKDYTPFQAKEISGIDYEKMGTLTTAINKDNLLMLNDNQKKKFDHNPNTDKADCLTLAQGRAGSSDEYMDSVSKIAKIQGNIRRLTPTECERLQTVPDGYTNFVSDSQRYRMLGNGWTISVIEHILKHLVL